ncbi:MAG: serine protease [Zavarzinella sp.]
MSTKPVRFLLLSLALLLPSQRTWAEDDPEVLYKNVVNSAVFIVVPDRGGIGMGSGSLIDAEKKLVLTNYHVVADQKTVWVQFPVYDKKTKDMVTDKKKYMDRIKYGEASKGTVLYRSTSRDLAIVELDRVPPGAKPIPIAVKPVGPGRTVFSIGSPGALNQVFGFTEGRVRTVGQDEIEYVDKDDPRYTFKVKCRVITATNPTNPGDSGGPMFDNSGSMVGVTTGGMPSQQNVSYFIDASEVLGFLKEKGITLSGKAGTGSVTSIVPKDPKDPSNPKTPGAVTDELEKKAKNILALASAYADDPALASAYKKALSDVISKYPMTNAAKEAKQILDRLK